MNSVSSNLTRFAAIGMATLSALYFSGCSTDSHAAKGATQGAAVGALASAAGSAMTAAIFGGNVGEAAARGAVYGGTAGAVAGGVRGGFKDAEIKKKEQASLEALKEKIGEDAYVGLGALAECRHEEAFAKAEIAKTSDNPNFKVAGVWLEVLAYADMRQEGEARTLFPEVIETDWDVKNEEQAEAKMRRLLNELMDLRQKFKLPRVCG